MNERTGIATLLTNPKTLNMPKIAAKLANRLKQPYSKRRIRLYDKTEKIDLLEKLNVGLMEVVRRIGTDGDPLHRAYVKIALTLCARFAIMVMASLVSDAVTRWRPI